jgi:beta-lactamase superfamily II metal-dependent hydrolase
MCITPAFLRAALYILDISPYKCIRKVETMADFYELDFLEVHTSKSGDAIAIRYERWGQTSIHVVDAGYAATGDALVTHIRQHYGNPDKIDHVVVTHPDQDHAEGIIKILENFEVGTLWMNRPWVHAADMIHYFPTCNSIPHLESRLHRLYPYLDDIEKLAIKQGVDIRDAFQGATIGAFTVLAPSRQRFIELVAHSDRTPEVIEEARGINWFGLDALVEVAKKAIAYIQMGWGEEKFSPEATSNENEMSIVQFAHLNNDKILLTADAGREGMDEAADYAPLAGLTLPGINRFQTPHHGSRRNVSTEILDRWLGERLDSPPEEDKGQFTAIISAAREDPSHPRKATIRGLRHRGARVLSTGDGRGTKRIYRNAPERQGWSAAISLPYPDTQED